jgi:hypothetical protein
MNTISKRIPKNIPIDHIQARFKNATHVVAIQSHYINVINEMEKLLEEDPTYRLHLAYNENGTGRGMLEFRAAYLTAKAKAEERCPETKPRDDITLMDLLGDLLECFINFIIGLTKL